MWILFSCRNIHKPSNDFFRAWRYSYVRLLLLICYVLSKNSIFSIEWKHSYWINKLPGNYVTIVKLIKSCILWSFKYIRIVFIFKHNTIQVSACGLYAFLYSLPYLSLSLPTTLNSNMATTALHAFARARRASQLPGAPFSADSIVKCTIQNVCVHMCMCNVHGQEHVYQLQGAWSSLIVLAINSAHGLWTTLVV